MKLRTDSIRWLITTLFCFGFACLVWFGSIFMLVYANKAPTQEEKINTYTKQEEQRIQQCIETYYRVSLATKSCYNDVLRYLENEVYIDPQFAKKHRLWACEMRQKGYQNPFISEKDCRTQTRTK